MDIINASRLFDFDENYIVGKDTIKFVIEWGTIYLKTYKLSKNDNENINEILRLQINELLAKQNDFNNIKI